MIKQFTFFRKQIHGRGMLSHMSGTIRIAVAIRNLLLLFIMLTLAALVKGQDPIDLKLSVLPPYNTSKILNYFDTPYKMILTIRNTTLSTIDAYIDVKITDNAGITVSSDRKYWKKLTLAAGETFKLNQTNYDKIINTDHLVYKGITKDQIAQGIIPENDYMICIAAYDLKNSLLSAEEPGGCVTIPVNAVNPPEIILPVCNENILATDPQNILFSWSMPVGAPATTQYILKIVQIIKGQSPIEAMKRNRVIFEKSVNATNYLYSNLDPLLNREANYAYSIKATDPDSKVNFRNEGLSEVCSFSYMDSKIPGDLCKDFLKVILTKNPSGGACCYDLSVSNLYKGGKAGAPWSFSIGIDHASILTISDSIPANWVRTPSRLGESDDKMGKTGQRTSVKSTKKITWNAKSGEIPGGTTKLDKICFGDITGDSVYLKYTWRDSRKQIICLDSILLDCRQPAQCCLYYLVFSNEKSDFINLNDTKKNVIKNKSRFNRIVIQPLGGAKINYVDCNIDNEFVDQPDIEWTETNDALFNEIIFTYMKGFIPENNAGECLKLVPGLQIDNVSSTAKLRVSWYNGTNLLAQQEIQLQPCFAESATNDSYIESTNWKNFTQKTIGARLNVNSFAFPIPVDCEKIFKMVSTNDDCPNSIKGVVDCINSVDEMNITLVPKNVDTDKNTYTWEVTHENSDGTNTATNISPNPATDFGYKIKYTSYGKNTISANLTEKTPTSECTYTWDKDLYIPKLDIHIESGMAPNTGIGICPFIVYFYLSDQNNTLVDIVGYTWLVDNTTYTSTVKSKTVTLNDAGEHTLHLSVKDKYGCVYKKDTTFTLTYECEPAFDWTYEWCQDENCNKNITVKFTNKSKGGYCPSFKMDYGDGTSETITTKEFQHVYEVSTCSGTTFDVTMQMKDTPGLPPNDLCEKTIMNTITIAALDVGTGFTYISCPDGKVRFHSSYSVKEWNFIDVKSSDIDNNGTQDPVVTYYPPNLCVPATYVAKCTLQNPLTHATCEVVKEFQVTKSYVNDTKKEANIEGPKSIDGRNFIMCWDFKMKFRANKTIVKSITSIFRRYVVMGVNIDLPSFARLETVTASFDGKLFREGATTCGSEIPDSYTESKTSTVCYREKIRKDYHKAYFVNACSSGDYFRSSHDATFKNGYTWGGPFIKVWDYYEGE